jgi:hypothetical protein
MIQWQFCLKRCRRTACMCVCVYVCCHGSYSTQFKRRSTQRLRFGSRLHVMFDILRERERERNACFQNNCTYIVAINQSIYQSIRSNVERIYDRLTSRRRTRYEESLSIHHLLLPSLEADDRAANDESSEQHSQRLTTTQTTISSYIYIQKIRSALKKRYGFFACVCVCV